jgi:hypothetical protein
LNSFSTSNYPSLSSKSLASGSGKQQGDTSAGKRGRRSAAAAAETAALPEMSAQDAATAAALAAMFMAPGMDPEERISVVNVENGQRLVGGKAPRRIDLPMWLISHPNYLPDESEIINLAIKQGQMNNAEFQQQQRRGPGKNSKHSNVNENDEDSCSPKPASSHNNPHTPLAQQKAKSKVGYFIIEASYMIF